MKNLRKFVARKDLSNEISIEADCNENRFRKISTPEHETSYVLKYVLSTEGFKENTESLSSGF